MPIISYLAHPHDGKKVELLEALSTMDQCDVIPAENKNLLIVVTDTETDEEQDNLKQLAEAYSYKSSKEIKTTFKLFKSIVDACDIIITEQKTLRKPRIAKKKSATQLASKLKYKASDSEYGIASVGPDKLIGAVAATVFNCKNRKLGIYVAQDSDGFSIKGTTLHNFNDDMSFQKTIRKPDVTLGMFKSSTKAKSIKEFSLIKASGKTLNGRFNSETIILAVFK